MYSRQLSAPELSAGARYTKTEDPGLYCFTDRATAHAFLRDQLALSADSHLVALGEGDSCFAFRLGAITYRVAKHHGGALSFEKESSLLHRISAELPVRVPRPLCHYVLGRAAFAEHVHLTGHALARDQWRQMPPLFRDKLAADLAAFLDALHALPVELGRECGIESVDIRIALNYLRELAGEILFPRITDAAVTIIERRFEEIGRELSHHSPVQVLIHGDLGSRHILVGGDRVLSGIIDFTDISISDPARDFQYLYQHYGSELLLRLLRSYSRESSESLYPRIRAWSFIDVVGWTLRMSTRNDKARLAHGISEIMRETSSTPRP